MSMTVTKQNILSMNQVAARFGVTRQTIYAWVRAGDFPMPVRVGKRRLYWTEQMLKRVMLGLAPGPTA
jgi:excisionase family DNA binding protein